MSRLFTPIRIGSVEIRNRVWVAPMCQYSCEEQDGVPGDWHREHLTSFARGGAGLVITEAAAVSPEGRISPQDAGIWNDAQADAWAPITERIRVHGAVPGIQLAHAGRKASNYRPWAPERGTVPVSEGGWQMLGPTDEEFEGFDAPRAMTGSEVEQVVADFAAAASRAVAAGFAVLELHAAHGYLLHQFLSPLSNTRSDQWGERTLLLQRVTEAVRAAAPEAGLMVRFSASDWIDGGVTPEMTAEFARVAAAAGADFFDISSGGLDARQKIAAGPGYQLPFARAVREQADVQVAAVGLITDPAQAEQVLADGDADAVLLGRELLRNPHWPMLAEAELDGAPDGSVWPAQYTRARP